MALIYANKIPTLAEAQAAAAKAVRVRDACIRANQHGEGLTRAPQRQGDAPGGRRAPGDDAKAILRHTPDQRQ